ncbi:MULTISPECIES: HrpT family type III secretion system protein [Erwinia]|uniref:HrpT n=1 Tax=Erwinia pyrifoliae TaxID=79967 RepID=Q6QPK6_ERWPY|nr:MULTISPECIES: HrpT family type III secretion system protein [Erwinia]AAS45459.1 HrpT [Erwinia pyrifoliae]ADP11388.1 hrp/hrc Type III secretion system-Hrp/hrc secretion/translocation pathway-hrpT protein [Erwinia sp. Ejp617]AUX71542.1 type III secretion protein HrpT [Erwinia pyrifoliae]MCA8878238.1 type III secretion protein HrpT [Erwinia pyrifoliae]MCT2386025.1 type III secretion protein HrpT [Erwinia pyrifoliae]
MKSASCLLLASTLLLTACAGRHDNGLECTSVDCRPQSQARQLVIWWQPGLRNGPADYTRVSVNE